ncbi:MAG: CDP-glycerol glycerophosphotransferase family protein [Bacteroidales bacterium]|nr:CDP-glycerol glycerophosphotransferase family protein [Bacteroidales bacterium]
MDAIFINRKLSHHDLKIIRGYMHSENPPELYSSFSLPGDLSALCKGSGEPEPEKKRAVNFEVFEKILHAGEKKINGTPLADLFTFEKANLWHYHKFRLYFQMRNLWFGIEQIAGALESYDRVIVFTPDSDMRKYPFDEQKVRIYTGHKHRKLKLPTAFIGYAAFVLLRVLSGLFRPGLHKVKKHIIVDHAIPQNCLNLHTLKEEKANYNLAYLFQKIEDDFLILDDVEIPRYGGKSGFMQRRAFASSNRLPGEMILLGGLLAPSVHKAFSGFSLLLGSRYRTMANCCKDPFDIILSDKLARLHKTSRFFLFKYLAYKRYFRSHPALSVASIDENSPRIKTILDAAKANSINTFGIQHGTMHQLHPAYIYTEADKKRGVVPDYTFVWGDHWKDFLYTFGKYPDKSIITSGQIRTDIIPALLKGNLAGRLQTPEGSKIVMFASQPQRDPALRRQAAFDMFSAVKEHSDIFLVVKLHPAEKHDMPYYHSIAREAGCTRYRLILYFDLYLLISMSDVVITCFSTVGAETTYFRKPLIILDHLRQDIQGYHREGIALQATNAGELNVMIRGILDGTLLTDEKAYDSYIEKFAFRIDGRVAERIMENIREIIGKK